MIFSVRTVFFFFLFSMTSSQTIFRQAYTWPHTSIIIEFFVTILHPLSSDRRHYRIRNIRPFSHTLDARISCVHRGRVMCVRMSSVGIEYETRTRFRSYYTLVCDTRNPGHVCRITVCQKCTRPVRDDGPLTTRKPVLTVVVDIFRGPGGDGTIFEITE